MKRKLCNETFYFDLRQERNFSFKHKLYLYQSVCCSWRKSRDFVLYTIKNDDKTIYHVNKSSVLMLALKSLEICENFRKIFFWLFLPACWHLCHFITLPSSQNHNLVYCLLTHIFGFRYRILSRIAQLSWKWILDLVRAWLTIYYGRQPDDGVIILSRALLNILISYSSCKWTYIIVFCLYLNYTLIYTLKCNLSIDV